MKKLLGILVLGLLLSSNAFAEIDKIKNLDTIKFILNKESTSPSGIEMGSYLCWADNNKSNYSAKKMPNRTCHRTFLHKLFNTMKADNFKRLYEEFLSITDLPKCKGEYSTNPTKNDSLNWNNCLGFVDADYGEIIIAPFKEGYISGLGIRIEGDFSIYIGEFVDDYMHGKGVIYISTDTLKNIPVEKKRSIVIEGIWEEDEFVKEISRKNIK